MTDPFPQLTSFLENVLLYMIFLGIILAGISGVVCGILYLPIFGLSERRREIAGTALRATVIGLLVILLALPARAALIHFFPLPTNLPPIPVVPMTTPGTTPSGTPSPGS
jgi:cytochrome b561